MDVAMWVKALQIIPRITEEEWKKLDIISRWLISTRAAVLVMTFMSAAVGGLFAVSAGKFDALRWLLMTLGLVLAHATNNLLNDLTDFERGVDKDNYFRTQYGPQPVQQGLMTRRQLLTYAGVTGALAAACGVYLAATTPGPMGWLTWALMAAGAVFVLFYTWPLKYIGLGEVAVIIVWGPLMVAGGYFAVTGQWDWNVALASLPYALGPTMVIFGKHIDKIESDTAKGIGTLPVRMGEKTARAATLVMLALQYVLVVGLVISGFFTPVMLVVLLALSMAPAVYRVFRSPRPADRPAEYRADIWPLWFVAIAFGHSRRFGMFYLLGLTAQIVLHVAGVM